MSTPPPDRPSSPAALGPVPRYDVLTVGAGLSGMYQPHLLRQLGLSARVFEAGAVGGGTWVVEPTATPAPASTRRAGPTASPSRRRCSGNWNTNVAGKQRRTFLAYAGGAPAHRKRCDEVAAMGCEGFALA